LEFENSYKRFLEENALSERSKNNSVVFKANLDITDITDIKKD
jgi:hypothetical protein